MMSSLQVGNTNALLRAVYMDVDCDCPRAVEELKCWKLCWKFEQLQAQP